MKISLNKDKNIGKVLFIVEGQKTEPYVLTKIFSSIFDYQVEIRERTGKYRICNSKSNPNSKVFIINSEESNIRFIKKDNEFLNNLFKILIEEYDFDVDNAAIYYIFDRDVKSNTESDFFRKHIWLLSNSRENIKDKFLRQGLLLISYPCIESFVLSNFISNSSDTRFAVGDDLKKHMNTIKVNQQRINAATLKFATDELLKSLEKIGLDPINPNLFDDFSEYNLSLFDSEEKEYQLSSAYRCISLLAISLMDLGLIEFEE